MFSQFPNPELLLITYVSLHELVYTTAQTDKNSYVGMSTENFHNYLSRRVHKTSIQSLMAVKAPKKVDSNSFIRDLKILSHRRLPPKYCSLC